MNIGWIKSYRKAQDNEIWHDKNAWRVFQWILWNVDYVTGKNTFGRKQIADGTGLKQSTVYKVAGRLHEKYQVIVAKSNNKFTEISVINWDKYQQDSEKVAGMSREKEQVAVAKSNNNNIYIKNKRIKEEKNNIRTIIAEAPQLSVPIKEKKETKVHQRLPVEKQLQIHRLVYFLEDIQSTAITNWGKQGKALKMMLDAGYTEKQISYVIKQMAKDEWFTEEKGFFDLMDVNNQMPKYKAIAMRNLRKETNGISHQTYEI